MAKVVETWETTTDGTVWVSTTDSRGNPTDLRVGGKRGSRLRITEEDRISNQETLVEESVDPFTNGLLHCVSRTGAEQATAEAGSQALSAQDLVKILASTGNAFQAKVRVLNELNLRRLKDIADEMDASVRQVDFINTELAQYAKGGSQKVYEEIQGLA